VLPMLGLNMCPMTNQTKYIVSFGFRHGTPQHDGAVIVDVRPLLNKNPYHNKQLRHLRGTDPEVQRDIEKTPGFEQSYEILKKQVDAATGVVYLGCTGGRHRSVYMAERIGKELNLSVMHRDKDKRH
jgi:UPF0042 nucleotide-binding protein